jgi:ATP-dependent helicase HrpB
MLLLAAPPAGRRAAAHRMASLEPAGGPKPSVTGCAWKAGWARIPASRWSPKGVLTRMLQHDPSLTGVGLVIFDEFHERSLDADLGLALCRDIQGSSTKICGCW